ncbi:MAG: endonuclease/exonuclease/phosphatase family protein [Acidobacteriota bacterium]|nr:endonuclease/exonuclease/phosphatase family protein [Blastocatellia bacterium]MDW8413722.1 endonuclease/exonuclease/phosphatase family protein [Acidobacteriota bacterium]
MAVLLFMLLFLSIATAQEKPIIIATWNVKDFFDSVDDPLKEDTIYPPEAVSLKIRSIATVIKAIDPDVLALQEVENLDLLKRLNSEGGLNYSEAVLVEGNDPRGIDVALLSRLKVTEVRSHKDDDLPDLPGIPIDYRFSRDCLEVHLEAPSGLKFIALVNHFVSKAQGAEITLPRREAQAIRVRKIVEELQAANPEVKIVVLGDLNDTPDSSPIKKLTKGKPKDSRLYDATSVLPPQERYSFVFRGVGELIDYALFNRSFKPLIDNSSVRILHDPIVDQASDHDPVIVGVKSR